MKYFEASGRTLELPYIHLKPEYGAYSSLCCNFCRLGINSNRKSIPLNLRIRRSIMEEFIKIITPYQDRVAIQSCEILRYPYIMDLLNKAVELNKKSIIIGPIPSLAKRSLVKKIRSRIHSIETTFLTTVPLTYQKMTGNKNACLHMKKALMNIYEEKIPFSISIVITRMNIKELSKTILYHAQHSHTQQSNWIC